MSMETQAWAGGECPLNPDAVVFVTFRDGLMSKARRAKTLRWVHIGQNDDIAAYRVLSDGSDEPADAAAEPQSEGAV